MKFLMGFLMLLVYSSILVHDFIPHHTHSGIEYVYFQTSDQVHHHSDCDHEQECQFPFHHHNINEAGLFFSPIAIEVDHPFQFDLNLPEFSLADDNPPEEFSLYAKIQALDYCEPDITATSLRGPPRV